MSITKFADSSLACCWKIAKSSSGILERKKGNCRIHQPISFFAVINFWPFLKNVLLTFVLANPSLLLCFTISVIFFLCVCVSEPYFIFPWMQVLLQKAISKSVVFQLISKYNYTYGQNSSQHFSEKCEFFRT